MNSTDRHIILGIETSCDETGLALLQCDPKGKATSILSEAIHSQVDLHKEYGGVVPELAAREHLTNLPLLLETVLTDAGLSLNDVDTIAVTTGPGLKGCLLCGMLFASGLSVAKGIPLVPVNHIEAHVLSVFLNNQDLTFPFLSLIVSGGHTELHYVEGIGQYTLLARTIDDAAGEAFDKSAKLFGLGYPGGPALAKLADSYPGKSSQYELPRVMLKQPGFSFSGLKTAISLLIKGESEALSENKGTQEVAWTIQESIISALTRKVEKARKLYQCNTLTVCGGVSANKKLRSVLEATEGLQTVFPKFKHCMDNGTMIALTAHLRELEGLPKAPFEAQPRWPIETAKDERV